MTPDRIKEKVRSCLNMKKNFVFYGTRNQNEVFEGVITEMYPAVFIIKVSGGQIRSFSYSDLLVGNLEIVN